MLSAVPVELAVLEAIAEPTRQRILDAVRDGERSVGELVEHVGMHQPGVSRHLKVLREAGLVVVSRRGVWAYYAPSPHGLALLREVGASLATTALAAGTLPALNPALRHPQLWIVLVGVTLLSSYPYLTVTGTQVIPPDRPAAIVGANHDLAILEARVDNEKIMTRAALPAYVRRH